MINIKYTLKYEIINDYSNINLKNKSRDDNKLHVHNS